MSRIAVLTSVSFSGFAIAGNLNYILTKFSTVDYIPLSPLPYTPPCNLFRRRTGPRDSELINNPIRGVEQSHSTDPAVHGSQAHESINLHQQTRTSSHGQRHYPMAMESEQFRTPSGIEISEEFGEGCG